MRGLALTLLVVLLLPGCAQLAGPGSDARVEVTSWTLVRDASGLRLVGEVANRGGTNAESIRVVAQFADASGAALGSQTTAAWRRILGPGEACPFDMPAPEGATNATLRALGAITHTGVYDRQSLFARDLASHPDASGANVTFEGSAVNGGELTIMGVEAQLTFRDDQGRVVGAARVSPDAPALRAGEASPFRGSAALSAHFTRVDVTVVTLAQPT